MTLLILFYSFATLAICLAMTMIIAKRPIISAISLVGVMFCLAGLFAMLNAHLIAALQVLVYAGAIMVLFMFVIMLLNVREKEGESYSSAVFIQIGSVGILAAMLLPFMTTINMTVNPNLEVDFGTTFAVGKVLFTDYLLPFEIASVLLLAGLVGAVMLSKIKIK
ncbi:MAG TPA: NADH-quinone oxidoreductase subunit J [Nitrospinota bacterium]|nr:NADH-quinone oxidoreductase subunit J [Nitrospinota bacterium]